MSKEKKNDKEGLEGISKETLPKSNFQIRKSRILLLFFIGLLVGIVLKTQATKTVTIGFDDYRLSELKGTYEVRLPKIPAVEESVEEEDSEGTLEEAVEEENE